MPMIRLLACLAVCLLLAACAGEPSTFGPVRDTQRLSQDPRDYVQPGRAQEPMLPESLEARGEAQVRRFYAPWGAEGPIHPAEDVFCALDRYANRTVWAENLRPRDPAWLDELAANADPASYPNTDRRAVALANAPLRLLPTDKPLFLDPAQAGEGFPFDYLQNSLLPAGAPLHVSHVSKDKTWLLVETAGLFGWVRARNAAFVDPAFMRLYRGDALWAPLRDGDPVRAPRTLANFQTRLGMLLPLAAREEGAAVVVLPRPGHDGVAVPALARLDAASGAEAPLPLTQAGLAGAAAPLMGQPYGWGGLYGNRDCSATLQDLFTPFGIELPRNSRDQIEAGPAVDLSGLDREAKLARIREAGVPWRTLLYKPGHILLYLGELDGEPVALHTMWGVKTRGPWGREGRRVVGATVITTLSPGTELDRLAPDGDLLESLTALRVLGETR